MSLNKQEKTRSGQLKGRGIQWTDFTWNPIAGCKHGCEWKMPNGDIAKCYAGDVARKFTTAYPDGFEAHYWRPKLLNDPIKQTNPSNIFVGSMTDIFGHWVPEHQINQVLDTIKQAPWHSFQLLTKNPVKVKNFDIPVNAWVGASSPPDFMWGKALDQNRQEKMLHRTLGELGNLTQVKVRWMSVEPLSWDISSIVAKHEPLQWAVIGAATNGPKVFQPNPEWVSNLLDVFDRQGVPVFFKGNLWGNEGIGDEWREYFPGFEQSRFMGMELGKHALPIKSKTRKEVLSEESKHRAITQDRLQISLF